MKKIFYFLTIFTALLSFAACEEIIPDELPDDDGTTNPPTSYVNNKIYYTSDDEQIIEPTYVNFGEGVEIVSNVYEDGQGIITFNQDITEIGNAAFSFCTRLTSITLPDGITDIGEYVFVMCPLTSIIIPDSVTKIGEGAFNACGIEYITIPDGVTEIGEGAFAACHNLKAFYGRFASEDNRCLIIDGVLNAFASADITYYAIPNGVTEIKDVAFFGSYIENITIPDSVTKIGAQAFEGCFRLTSITIPDSVTNIGYGAFSQCTNMTAFYGAFSSEDNRCLIVDGVLNSFAPIGLTSYTIPDYVTEIGYGAFRLCGYLTNITIPDGVTVINTYAFWNCIGLESITIPDSVTGIGWYAFEYCYRLASVYCEAVNPPVLCSDAFNDNASGRKIYVPRESVEAYKSAEGWEEYADDIEGYDFQ